ncbi:MAG: hypothetical protein JSV82_06060 [Planctomycetota bacterium]|nr:MAG: hypothetical protein JSV82_06060 [Planctomycetota bacterium]
MKRQRINKAKGFCFAFAACVALLLSPGCAETQQFKVVEQICVGDISKPEAMQAVEDVLGEMHFTIEKTDVEHGQIKTRPLSGAQTFEFWRSDNVGAFNSAEANLHSLRRTVKLDINQQGEQLCIGCNVKTQKLSLPESQISSSSQAYGMFSKSCPSIQKLVLKPAQKSGMGWVDVGEDDRLATKILKRVEVRISNLQKEERL